MENYTIIHNPRCSKSRETLDLLKNHGINPKIVDYLGGELTNDLLGQVFKALKTRPKEILRTKEELFSTLNLDIEDDAKVIDAIIKHPVLLERPIVLKGDTGVIGRPPENALSLIKK